MAKKKIMKNKKQKDLEEKEIELNFEGLKKDESEFGEELNLGGLDFNQFVNITSVASQSSAPVLERITGGQERPIFVGTIPQGGASASEEKEDKGGFKYVPSQEQANEPKYIESDSRINVQPAHISFERAGRENPLTQNPLQMNKEDLSERFSGQRNFESQAFEKKWQPDRFDTRQAGRRNPLEVDEKKYEKYKPDLPKP